MAKNKFYKKLETFNIEDSVQAEKRGELLAIKDSVRTAFRTGGRDESGEIFTIKDALAYPDSHLVFEQVITEIVQESIEPNLIGHLLLDQIQTTDRGLNQVTIRTIGALGDIDIEVGEEGEYKEVFFGRGQGSLITVNYQKFGLKLKITEEMVNASQWNLIELWIRKAVQHFGREREKRIFRMLDDMGTVVFDNLNPAQAEIGRTFGRDIHGVGNGSITHSDLIDMYSSLATKGYQANVMLVHPMHWAMFAKDPIIREAGLVKGDISAWLQSQVNPVNPYKYIGDWTNARRNAVGDRPGLTDAESYELLQTKPTIPSFSPLSGLTVIPSPYVPYDKVNKTASIILIDTSNTGAIVINEPISLDSWENKENDVQVVKIKEKYGMAIYDQGRAVAIAKNISIEPNEIFNNPQTVLTDLPVITRK